MTGHRYESSYSGMVCGAMVLVPDALGGYGDQCGRRYDDPIHSGYDDSDWDTVRRLPPRIGSKTVRPAWFIRVGDVVRYEVGNDDPHWQVGIVQQVTEGFRPDKIRLWTGPVSHRTFDRNFQVEWLGRVDPETWSLNPIYDTVRSEFQR